MKDLTSCVLSRNGEDADELDPVVAEVRLVRERYAASFNYDIRRMAADLREREQQHSARLVAFPPRHPANVIAGP